MQVLVPVRELGLEPVQELKVVLLVGLDGCCWPLLVNHCLLGYWVMVTDQAWKAVPRIGDSQT